MTILFVACAAVGGTILVLQFLLALVGLGGDAFDLDVSHDVGHDFAGDLHGGDAAHADHSDQAAGHGSSWLFGVLSFRTIVAALAFFGLGGLAAQSADASATTSLGIALTAGGGALFGVYWMLRGMYALKAEGTVRIHRAVGKTATVYLKVPGRGSGIGKIQINLQNRTMEYSATTAGEAIATGARVVVVDVVTPTTLEVQPLAEPERTDHV